jgi:hypothetical protein
MVSKSNIPEFFETAINELKGSDFPVEKIANLFMKLSEAVNVYDFHTLVNDFLKKFLCHK